MHIINVTVRDKIATHVGDVYYVCGNSDFVVRFDFDEEWDALDVKTARFICEDGSFRNQVFSGSECPVPIISNTNSLRVGVFAGNLCTTTPARVPAAKSILCPGGMPAAPEDDAYHQVMEEMAKVGHEARSSAEASAQSAQEAATSAQEAAQAAASAGTYLDNVGTNAKAAAAAAQAAKQSETAAAASAESAEKAKETAIANADDAEEAANTAKASAQTAGTLASQAADSASSAATSAKNAEASAQAAKQSETAAAASAKAANVDAAASARNAQATNADAAASAQNAQAAASSAQAAKQSETAAEASSQAANVDAAASAQNAQAAASSAQAAKQSETAASESAGAAATSAQEAMQAAENLALYIITQKEGGLDRTYAEIVAAIDAARPCILVRSPSQNDKDRATVYTYAGRRKDRSGVMALSFASAPYYENNDCIYEKLVYVYPDGTTTAMDSSTRSPNPYALTIKQNGTTSSYNGRTGLTVEIPTVPEDAGKLYIVTVTSTGTSWVSDRSRAEIDTAQAAGKACLMHFPDSGEVMTYRGGYKFASNVYSNNASAPGMYFDWAVVNDDKTVDKYGGGPLTAYPGAVSSSMGTCYLRWNGTKWEAATIAQLKSDLGLT